MLLKYGPFYLSLGSLFNVHITAFEAASIGVLEVDQVVSFLCFCLGKACMLSSQPASPLG